LNSSGLWRSLRLCLAALFLATVFIAGGLVGGVHRQPCRGHPIDRGFRLRAPKWWAPDDVVALDALPHTATGKLNKLALGDRFRGHLIAADSVEEATVESGSSSAFGVTNGRRAMSAMGPIIHDKRTSRCSDLQVPLVPQPGSCSGKQSLLDHLVRPAQLFETSSSPGVTRPGVAAGRY
jgi:hypothetical protein